MNLLDGMRVFATVVETKSLTVAGKRLRLAPSTVSKHISMMEERFGVRLINRTTRRLSVTAIGQSFYQRCTQILEDIDQAALELSELNGEPKGNLKVTAPTAFAVRHLSPRLPEFVARYPGIRLEFVLTSEYLDLLNQGIDLAIRFAGKPDPSLNVIRLSPSPRVFCASPAYLAKHSRPQQPEELRRHNCLIASGQTQNHWPFRTPDGPSEVLVEGSFVANNPEMIRHAAISGIGVALLPTWLIADDLAAGALVPILEDFEVVPMTIHALAPHKRFLPFKTRVFIEWLQAYLTPVPPWEAWRETVRAAATR